VISKSFTHNLNAGRAKTVHGDRLAPVAGADFRLPVAGDAVAEFSNDESPAAGLFSFIPFSLFTGLEKSRRNSGFVAPASKSYSTTNKNYSAARKIYSTTSKNYSTASKIYSTMSKKLVAGK